MSNKSESLRIATEIQYFTREGQVLSHDDVKCIQSPGNEQSKKNTLNQTKTPRAIGFKISNSNRSNTPILVGRVTPRVVSVEKQIPKPHNRFKASTSTTKADHMPMKSYETTSAVIGVQNSSQDILQSSNNITKCIKKKKFCMICLKCDCVCETKPKMRVKPQDKFINFSKDPEINTFNQPEVRMSPSHALAKKARVQEFTREVIIVPCTRKVTIIPPKVAKSISKKRKRVRIRNQRQSVKKRIQQTEPNFSEFTGNVGIQPSTSEQNLEYARNSRCDQRNTTIENAAPPNKTSSVIRQITPLPTQNNTANINDFQRKNVENENERVCANDFIRTRIAEVPAQRSGISLKTGDEMIGAIFTADYKVTRHDSGQFLSHGLNQNKKVELLKGEKYLSDISNEKESSVGHSECLSDISDDVIKFMASSRTNSNIVHLRDISEEEITEAYKHENHIYSDISDCESDSVMNDKVFTGRDRKCKSSKEKLKQRREEESRSALRKPRVEGASVTYRGEMSHVNAFIGKLEKRGAPSHRYWTKITVTGYPANWTRDQMMDTFVNWRDLAYLHFWPCFIDFTPEKCMFLVYNCTEALKFLLNSGLVVHGDGFRLNLGLRHVMFRSRLHFNQVSKLRHIVNCTYDKGERTVNFKAFMLGSDENKTFYCPLNKVYNQQFIAQLKTKIKWHQVTRHNLSSNRLA